MFNGIIPAAMYQMIYIVFMAILTIIFAIILYPQDSDSLYRKPKYLFVAIIIALALIFFIGLRPLSGRYFGDMQSYNSLYLNFASGQNLPKEGVDVIFYSIMYWFSQHVLPKYFFLFVAFVYIFPLLIASIRISRENATPIFIMIVSAFSFFGYATNGIRNGAAASLFILALTFLRGDYKNKIIYGLLCIVSYGFHSSMALPILASLAAYFIRNPKLMFYFWGVSLFATIFAGGLVSGLFSTLGFDARMEEYLSVSNYEESYTRSGFRWDFLLYSFMPILMGYFTIFKRRIYTRTYALLLGTYIYANAFWLMVIRTPYSNRFAYLSWCLYPIVLAYPMFELPLWKDRPGMKTVIVIVGHYMFTLLYWLMWEGK